MWHLLTPRNTQVASQRSGVLRHHGRVHVKRINRVVLRGSLVVVALPVAALLVAAIVAAGTMVMNNLRLDRWKSDLYQLEMPVGARVIAQGTQFGLLAGNGNHCDRRAWLEVATPWTAEEVERYYAERLETPSVWISTTSTGTNEVRVEMFEHGDSAGWDPRCH